MSRGVVAVITAVTNDRVVVCERELDHALTKHFPWLPRHIFLELLEQVLRDPTEVFQDTSKPPKEFKLYYRVERQKYLVAVVKVTEDGAFFSSLYPTGAKVRNRHKGMRKVKI